MADNTRRGSTVWWIIILVAVIVAAVLVIVFRPCPRPRFPRITDTYSNFDMHVWFRKPTNDLHLDLCCISPEQITWNYFSPGRERFVKSRIPCGTRVTWTFDSIGYCTRVHFGIGYKHSPCVRPIRVIWTYNGKPIARSPFPWQTWDVVRDTVLDIVWNQARDLLDSSVVEFDGSGLVEIGRSWAFSTKVLELPELMVNSKILSELKWNDEKVVTLKEGDNSILKIPLGSQVIKKFVSQEKNTAVKEPASVIVKYWVYSPSLNDTVGYFINQAVIKFE